MHKQQTKYHCITHKPNQKKKEKHLQILKHEQTILRTEVQNNCVTEIPQIKTTKLPQIKKNQTEHLQNLHIY